MKNTMRKVKISLLISAVSVIICLAGIIFAVMNLKYSIVNGTPTGSARGERPLQDIPGTGKTQFLTDL